VHHRIIGADHPRRGLLSGLLGVIALGALLAARPAQASAADPPTESQRVAALRAAAHDADRALANLIAQLETTIDAGRTGSALIVDGERDPEPSFEQAAQAAQQADALAATAAQAVADLAGVLGAVRPTRDQLPPASGVSMPAIAAQLIASGQAAGPFVERRQAAEGTVSALAEALQALEDDDPLAAVEALDRAEASRAIVADWPLSPTVLPFWLDTTAGMIAAARDIAMATIARDPVAAARAGRAYQRASAEARRADTALALAISETGSTLATGPMRRLAEALSAAVAQRDAVLAILAASS
jgi:hypothetical protein